MVRATDIVAYTFNADEYDPDCVVHELLNLYRRRPGSPRLPHPGEGDTETQLDVIATWLGINRQDERSYDSGDFPKVVFGSDDLYEQPDEDAEHGPDGETIPKPRRCGRCQHPLDPGYEEPHTGWRVTITVTVDADAADTPRDIALAAWDGITRDEPPVVTVHPINGDPADAVTVDLANPTA